MNSPPPETNATGGPLRQRIVVLDVGQKTTSQRSRGRLFAAAGFHVHGAPEAGQALEAAAEYKPDVVLLDWNEVELCRRLKAGPGNVPIVVLLAPSLKNATDFPKSVADLCLPKSLAPAFLIDAIGTLARLRRAEREIERSRGELVDFSRQLVHDIEGPLRGVVTFAELIGRDHSLSEKERTYLGHVLASADQVRRLARCVLTYAEVGREPPRLAVVPLRGVVAAATQALRERVKGAAAIIHMQDPLPSVLGDFSALQQVIQNLIGNSINYRRPDTSLSVTVGAREGSAKDWLISVSDNGIGVAKQYHESIFAPFKRLHGLEIPGAGMGLALCRQIVEAHGGRIWVESEPGCGASFLFTLRAPA
jgi:light-regulated signal transduction histidine kinase (bacteriophytochrome)